jgi:hypothetical protein
VWMVGNVELKDVDEEEKEDGWKEGNVERTTPRLPEKKATKIANRYEALDESEEETVEIMQVEEKHEEVEVEITVDSGAGASVWPRKLRGGGKLRPKNKMRFEAANGTNIENYGQKMVKFEPTEKEGKVGLCGLNFNVADVKKPLAAVSAIEEAGNKVVFGSGKRGNYIENIKTGGRIILQKKRGTYVAKVKVLMEMMKGQTEEDEEDPMHVDAVNEATGFTRRA